MKSLRASTRFAAALGFVSISLTGEIAPVWIVLIWSAWVFSFAGDRYPDFQAALRRFETAAVIGMIGLLFVDFFIFHNTIFIAVTHFLLFFQVVKLAGEKARKDCLQIFLFSFFQILAACTLSVDAWHAGVLILFIPTATAALFWNQMEKERADIGYAQDPEMARNYKRMAAGMCAAALPLNIALTAVVFVIFPRLQLNASLPGFGGQRMGYADQVNLAQTGSLNQNAAVVLWLSFPKPEGRRAWSGRLRGDVLGQFDGRRWSASKGGRRRLLAPDSNGIFFIRPHQPSLPLLRESITLADPSAATLFTSGKPLRIVAPLPALQENEEGVLHWSVSWRRPLRYEVLEEPSSDAHVNPSDLDLPTLPLQRIRDLARKAGGSGTPLMQARNMEKYLRKNYKYSVDYGDRIVQNPVDYFLFVRRQGACGHFASAMALMLRLRNIPSRLVAGYWKGEWNEPAQCVVVHERDAHAWAEAYIKGTGWVTFDPTPVPPAGAASHTNVLHLVEQYWDYWSYQWNRLVIQYDLYAQVKAIETIKGTWWPHIQTRFRETKTTEKTPWRWKEIATFLGLSMVALFLLFRPRGPSFDAPVQFYSRFLERMARAGHPKAPPETGWEFAQRLAAEKPEFGVLAYTMTEKYYLLRYGMGKP